MAKSLFGNDIELLHITNPIAHDPGYDDESKLTVAVSARARPGDAESSWCLRGVFDFIT